MITPPSEDGKGWKYIQPETGYVVSHVQFDELVKMVKRHRESHGLDTSDGWKERLQASMCLYNQSECEDPNNPQPYLSETQKEGRKLWKELHDKASMLPDRLDRHQQADLQKWLSGWELRVPSWGGCACRQHYYEFKSELPPQFDSGASFELWAQRIHDKVNAFLGKPLWLQQ